MRRNINILKYTDWFTIILYFLLVGIGWLNIYSATFTDESGSFFDFSQQYVKQLLWISLSIVLILIIFLIDTKLYSYFAYFVYVLLILLLIFTLLFGKQIHGTRSWLVIGSFQFQTAEFAKFATILALAKYISTCKTAINSLKTIFISAVIILLPAVIILLQNDTGSALVYIAFIILLFREGLSATFLFMALMAAVIFVLALLFDKIYILLGLIITALIIYWFLRHSLKELAAAVLIAGSLISSLWALNDVLDYNFDLYYLIIAGLFISSIIYLILAYRYKIAKVVLLLSLLFAFIIYSFGVNYFFSNVLTPYQQHRINTFLGKVSDPKGVEYNVTQSKTAISAGGPFGRGFFRGSQTKGEFVPEQSTDFIFCTVGEEWGFIGTTAVIILFCVLLLRLIYLAERQRAVFNRVFGYGLVSILFFHFAINIGMTIGLFPVIGIPLPFFSYGGSSLWAFTIILFIFLRIDANRSVTLL